MFCPTWRTCDQPLIRNMPRLSVDIDLTYLPLEDRETSLKNINEALTRIKAAITKNILEGEKKVLCPEYK